MYEKINFVDSMIKSANEFVLLNDRHFYYGFLFTVENYCIENKLLIGGPQGIKLLLNNSITKDSYNYDIYTDSPRFHGKQITDLLMNSKAPHVNKETIYLETNIPDHQYTININLRRLIKIHAIERYRGLLITELITPIVCERAFKAVDQQGTNYSINDKTKTNDSILCMSADMQLLSIYTKLYLSYPLTEYETYSELLVKEAILFEELRKSVTPAKVGGQGMDLNFVVNCLRTEIQNIPDIIYIGDYAVRAISAALKNKKLTTNSKVQLADPKNPRLQIICADKTADTLIERAQKQLTRKMPSAKLIKIKYDLKIPTDSRLMKTSIYVETNSSTNNASRFLVMDIFNSVEYEAVPYKKIDNCQVAGLFVVLKFKVLDFYIVKLIEAIERRKQPSGGNYPAVSPKLKYNLEQIANIRDVCLHLIAVDPFYIFQLDNYIGIYETENVVRKKLMKDVQRKPNYFPSYLPANHNQLKPKEIKETKTAKEPENPKK